VARRGYPIVKKIEDAITRFDTINERHRQQDRQTPRDSVVPQYLKEYCISFSDTPSRQRLRSASRHLLSVPRRRRTFGLRAFAVAGPTAWNSLRDDLRNLSCCDSYFGRFLRLKSIVFSPSTSAQ